MLPVDTVLTMVVAPCLPDTVAVSAGEENRNWSESSARLPTTLTFASLMVSLSIAAKVSGGSWKACRVPSNAGSANAV